MLTTRENQPFPEPIMARLFLMGKKAVIQVTIAEVAGKIASTVIPLGDEVKQASGGAVEALTEKVITKSVEALEEQSAWNHEPIKLFAHMLLFAGETRVALYESDRQYTIGQQILLLPKSDVAAFEVQKTGVIWHDLLIRLTNGTEFHCQVHRTSLKEAEKMRALLTPEQPDP